MITEFFCCGLHHSSYCPDCRGEVCESRIRSRLRIDGGARGMFVVFKVIQKLETIEPGREVCCRTRYERMKEFRTMEEAEAFLEEQTKTEAEDFLIMRE